MRQQLESELREARNEAAVAAAAVTREHNAELDALLKEFAESCMAGKVRKALSISDLRTLSAVSQKKDCSCGNWIHV